VTASKDRLCIITPDLFYGALLQDAKFPTYESKVIRATEQFASLAVGFMPEAFLVFSSHLGPSVLARTVIELRSKFPKAHLFQIEGTRQPKLSLLWSPNATEPALPKHFEATSVDRIDEAMRRLSEPALHGASSSRRLTDSQLAVIQCLAAGKSNHEIATERETSLRAVETLMNRSLSRLGASPGLNSRAKMVVAQKYLAAIQGFQGPNYDEN
jgi:DNA-binding CsgD family transcriptional regulator